MPTLEVVPNEAKDIERRKAKAQKHWEKILKAGVLQSTTSMQIGFHAYRLKLENLFGVLGFANEEEAQIASGVGESTWYANIRIAESFKDVAEDVFIKMKQGNAKAAMDLPESKRQDSYWLRLAETESLKKFAALVDEEMNGKARASDGKERSAKFVMDMPASRKKSVEQGIKEYGERIGVTDPGKSLEIMVAESTGGKGLMEAIAHGVERIREIKEAIQSGLSADEVLIKIDGIVDEMVLEFAGAIEQASQKQEEAA